MLIYRGLRFLAIREGTPEFMSKLIIASPAI